MNFVRDDEVWWNVPLYPLSYEVTVGDLGGIRTRDLEGDSL